MRSDAAKPRRYARLFRLCLALSPFLSGGACSNTSPKSATGPGNVPSNNLQIWISDDVAIGKTVAFGDPLSLNVQIKNPNGENVTVYPLNYFAKKNIKVIKDGTARPFLWTGLARSDEDSRISLRNGALVYALSGIYLFPGQYSVACEIDIGGERHVAETPLITVAMPEYETKVRIFNEIMHKTFEETPDRDLDIILWQLHGVLMRMEGDASVFTAALLRRNSRDTGRAAVLLKKETVQVLGKLMNKELVEPGKRERGSVKPAEIIRLMTEERALSVVYPYLMIMHYLDDIMTPADDAALEAFIEKIKKVGTGEAIFGAYMAGVSNGRYRAKHGNTLREEVMANTSIHDGMQGTIISYLKDKMDEDLEAKNASEINAP